MKKNLRTIKTTLIMGILCVSIFAAMTPTTSAGVIVNLQSVVNLKDYDQNLTNVAIKPRATGFSTDVEFEYFVTGAAGILNILGEALLKIHEGRPVKLKVEAFGYPSWATVTVSNWPTVEISKVKQDVKVTLTVKLGSDAPAYGEGEIRLRVTVDKVGLVEGVVEEYGFAFSAGFLPLVQAQFEGGESRQVGPMDTVSIPIEVQNLGNARTLVDLEVTNVPDGWGAVITNDIIIEEGEGSKSMAYLTVKPPKGFGYHDDLATIIVSYTPRMAENPTFVGDARTVNVLIESRGFSVIGLEIILIPLIIIIVLLLFIYYFVVKKRK